MSDTKTTTRPASIAEKSSTTSIAEEIETTNSALSTALMSKDRKLLLKNQLHLNLNVDSLDKRVREDVRRSAKINFEIGVDAPSLLEVVKLKKDDVSNLEKTKTVTTVPQIQQKEQKSLFEEKNTITSISSSVAAAATTLSTSSSSLLKSSPSALAKFNRIIDSTMLATDCYQQQQSDKRVATSDSEKHSKIDFIYKNNNNNNYDDDDICLGVEIDDNFASKVVKNNDDKKDILEAEKELDIKDDNQMKRNDVHYLLKQLNSFSDIEEIEIIDMKQTRQQQQHKLQKAVTSRTLSSTTTPSIATAAVITQSPTTTSLVIISPSSQSHKESRHVMRRFASLHQQHSEHQQKYQYQNQHHHAINASGGNLLELGNRSDAATEQQYLLQQFDDYLFESCHYLETNYFATTYRTAMIESSSHEFRPSTTTGTQSSQSPSADADADADASSPQSYEIHEIELPSVICRAPPPPPSPTRRFNTQARLTSSGVQTELTASLLSSTTTTTPHAVASESMSKSNSGISATSACSYASSTEQRQRMPFFKCCYASIDRWREKRSAAAAVISTNGCASSGSGHHGSSKTTGASGSRRQPSQKQQKKLERKSDSTV